MTVRPFKKPTRKQKDSAAEVVRLLKASFPHVECALTHRNPWELLCATILSAQCTDVRVNLVTPALFDAYPDAESMASAPQEAVEQLISSTGFFRQKAASLISMSHDIISLHDGVVPKEMDQLTQLRGVGRKTANVLIGVAFGGQAMVVDTHVKRISALLGWTGQDDPVKIEQDLMALHPQEEWTDLAHRLILHGRSICIANRPKCLECNLLPHCPGGANRTQRMKKVVQ